jgi:methyl-accepting chemotaxis protein
MARKELDWHDKNAKRDIQISTKLLAVIAGIVFLGTFGATFLTLNIFDKRMTSDIEAGLETTAAGINSTFTDWQTSLSAYTALIAMNPKVQQSVAYKNSRELQDILNETKQNIFIGFLAITDNKGVVMKGVNISEERDLSGISSISSALGGKVATAFDEIGDYDYALFASHPILYSGRVVGTITMGVDMVTNSEYNTVNMVKGSYGVECTITKGAVRKSSTMQNLIGVEVADADVLDTVLKRGSIFKGGTFIGKERFYAVYFPLRSGESVSGMCVALKSMNSIEKVANDTIKIVIPLTSLTVLILVLLAYRFVRWLMWRINNVTSFLKELETGDADLTKRSSLYIRDEIGDLIIHFNFFLEKLHEIISTLKDSKSQLYEAGKNMLHSSTDTVDAMNNLSITIDGVSAQIANQGYSVDRTASAVGGISSNISDLDSMIDSQASGVAQASAAVEEMIGNISSVNLSVDKMAVSFESLAANAQRGFAKQQAVNERIVKIEEQSQMLQEANMAISSIAEQTNLLAMNAAIEAAHAGEAGKGFSVVADEIRKLSETSSEQSATIGEQLNKIRESISTVVAASTESSEALNAMSSKIKETDELVLQIKAAMEEQNSGSKQISDALKSMNDSTVDVHKSSKEMSKRNENISTEMQSLQEVTENMKSGMEEMSGGAQQITQSSSSLVAYCHNVKDSIDKIGSQIDLFKV